jgi:LysM repeat protein
MGIRREEVISHPFSEDFSSEGSSSPETEREFDISSHDSDSISSSNMGSSDSGNCIIHQVSKLDTLAGLAIKYGVEIADIKRMNNLVSDLQMFAHKSLLIPIPGCHTQSPLHSSSTNSNNRKLPPKAFRKKPNSSSVYSLKSKSPPHKTSSAMSTLQRYYGLLPHKPDPSKEQCTEMALFSEATFTTNSNKSSGDQNWTTQEMYSRWSKKSDNDPSYDLTTPEMGESKRSFLHNTTSENLLTHPLLVDGFNFVRRSASASGLRLRF